MQTTSIVRSPGLEVFIDKWDKNTAQIPPTAQRVDIHTHTHTYIHTSYHLFYQVHRLWGKKTQKNKSRGVQGGGEERHKRQRLESVKPMEAWKTGICSKSGLAWKHTGASECDCG